MGKGGNDSNWCISLALCPVGFALLLCAALISPSDGITPEIVMFLNIFGALFIFISVSINIILYYFFPHDTDELKDETERVMRERARRKKRVLKRKNMKSALDITIPGFEDIKIRPKLDEISDSDESEDDGKVDPESRW
jgi:hypothetical protein